MTSVALHEIVFDEEIYPRATWSQSTVDRYTDAMLAGEMFPPIILESGTNRLLDGMHRTEAFRAVGRDLIPVDYREIPDGVPAKLYAASLSSRHGDPLASEDKRQTARETIQVNPDYSLVFIASYLGISRQTVSKYVGDLVERRRNVRKAKAALLSRAGKSVREIADELGVSKSEVSRNVADDIPGQLTEDLLREAAADLPVDADTLVAAILAERAAPAELERTPLDTQTPGPVDAADCPPADPGATPECLGVDMDCGRPLPCPDHPAIPGTDPAPAVESPSAPTAPQEPAPTPEPDGAMSAAQPAGSGCEKCGTELGAVEAADGYLRCEDCDPAAVHLSAKFPDGPGPCVACDPAARIAAVAEVAPEFVKPVEPEPAPSTLRLDPSEDEKRAAVQRDARGLLLRAVEILAPAHDRTGFAETWARQLGPYDAELSDLIRRATEAIATLDALIEGCGQ